MNMNTNRLNTVTAIILFVVIALPLAIGVLIVSYLDSLEYKRLEKKYQAMKAENDSLKEGLHCVWIEDDEALPADGKEVRILKTVNDTVYLGLTDYSTFKGEDYRKAIYNLKNK